MMKIMAAGRLLSGSHGHYMELNLGFFLQMGAYMSSDFQAGESGGFLGLVCRENEDSGPDFHDGGS
jgi:hypothetical protein